MFDNRPHVQESWSSHAFRFGLEILAVFPSGNPSARFSVRQYRPCFSETMKVERFLASPPLSTVVKEFMIIESNVEVANTILPDTSIVMAFRLKGTVLAADLEKKEILPAAVLTGLRKSSRTLFYTKSTSNLLVVLKEGGLRAFSCIPANELFGQTISMENLFTPVEVNEISERLAEAISNAQKVRAMEMFLTAKLIVRNHDALVGNAIQHIKSANGNIRVTSLASSLNISQDPFEKRFRAVTGTSPKHYANIIRLRNLIQKYSNYDSLTQASYDAGYFDQSHFIKDFRQFTGRPPKEFFTSTRFW